MEASAVPRVAPAGVAALASPGLLRLLSDDRLVALIRDGNTNAFEAVYDRHYRAILSFCRHMLGGADEAEDAVQHTFIAAYNDLVSSRKPIRLRAWLFTIARNRCLSILRARRERTAVDFEERATDGLAVQVQRRQDLRDLVVDINHLPEDQRAALVLAEIGALGHGEIGSVLGVPKDKVKALIFQARESLLADRAARDADCLEIREQLATMRGAALRRTTLRRHLRGCQGCREYRRELESQRRRVAVILPVAPTIALREAVVGVTAGGGLAGAGVAGGGLLGASSVLKGVAGKALIAALLAAAGTTGTILAVHDFRLHVLDPRLSHLAPAQAPSVLGATTAQLAPSVGTSSTPSSFRSSAGARASTPARALPGVSGFVAAPGHETATAKAIVHALTGQLNNLLTPVWPHEKVAGGGGTAPPSSTQAPTSPPLGLLAPVPVSPWPTTGSQPTTGSPSAPGSPVPVSGGTPPGPYAGRPTPGAPGPSGLSGSTQGTGTGTGTGTSPGSGTGSDPSGGSVGAGSGSTGGSGSGDSGGTSGSGGISAGAGAATVSGAGSGPGSGPGPTTPTTPTPSPDPTSSPTPTPGSDPGSPSGTGSGSGATVGSGPGTDPTTGSGSGSGATAGSDPGTDPTTGSGSGATAGSDPGTDPTTGSGSGATAGSDPGTDPTTGSDAGSSSGTAAITSTGGG